jgi:hypothetical protein
VPGSLRGRGRGRGHKELMGHSSPCEPAYRSLLLATEEGHLRRGQGMDDDGRDGQEGHLQSMFVDMGRADAGIMAHIARRDGEGENTDIPGGEPGQIVGRERRQSRACGERRCRAEPWCTPVDALVTHL